ncbi:MAG: glycosyltransferase [Sphaerobacteraceae bacterium]|nr:MAG: glycosyltransferase [Sphaerobacteraceae bacterium]
MGLSLNTRSLTTVTEQSPEHLATGLPDSQSLFPDSPVESCEATVVIPVRDEQETLGLTLRSLAQQVDLSGKPLDHATYEILVLINNTADDSASIARQIACEHPTLNLQIAEIDLPEHQAHVGQARRLLMDAACERFQSLGTSRGIIATTDADTILSQTWLAATQDAVRAGADAVGGRILVAPGELEAMEPDARSCHLRDVGYRYLTCQIEAMIDPPPGDPWPRHFQHFGASIAVTAEMYLRAGGLPVLPALEDVALYDRLMRIDARIRHSPDVRVYTSARCQGRTGWGFASQLHQWMEMKRLGEPFLVRSAEDIADEFLARRELRRKWTWIRSTGKSLNGSLIPMAERLMVPADSLDRLLGRGTRFGEVWTQIQCLQKEAGIRSERYPSVAIDQAIRELRQYIAGQTNSRTKRHRRSNRSSR